MEASNPGQQPTPAQAMAVGAAAGEAAASEQTAEAAQAAAAQATRKKADEVGLKFTDDDVDRFADGVVKALESRGAFEAPLEPVQPPPPPPAEAAGAVEPPAEPATPPAGEAPPVKRSWAQRFLGE